MASDAGSSNSRKAWCESFPVQWLGIPTLACSSRRRVRSPARAAARAASDPAGPAPTTITSGPVVTRELRFVAAQGISSPPPSVFLSMTSCRLTGALLLALVLVFPQGRAGADALPAGIARERIELAGADEPHTPPHLNRIVAFRYFAPGAGVPEELLVLVPGLNSGPNTFDLLARALTAASGGRLSVWVTEPRGTLLQDRRGIEAALAYRNPDFALAYYYGNFAIDGHRFRPLPRDATPYAAYWGLDVHLRDIRAVVQQARRRFPGAPILLGGHSLGAIMAAMYAAYDFDRVPRPGSPRPCDAGRGPARRDPPAVAAPVPPRGLDPRVQPLSGRRPAHERGSPAAGRTVHGDVGARADAGQHPL